jgi:hypothetical protein
MGLAPDYVAGDILLSQKGIGGDVSTFNVDSVEEGDSGFDFIRVLELFISRYGQGAHFFWV